MLTKDPNEPAPVDELPEGGTRRMRSKSSDTIYTVKRIGNVYSCDCPAWKFQKLVTVEQRTCKHIKAIRGEKAEEWRVQHAARGAAVACDITAGAMGQPKSTCVKKACAAEIQVLLAKTWDESIDPTGMLMSEKLDGVRAYWRASTRQLLSRLGNEFMAPAWFKEQLPDFDLDGELFGDRSSFQETVGIVKRLVEDEGWKKVRYLVFDAPSDEPFTRRYDRLQSWFRSANPKHAFLVEQTYCKGRQHLLKVLDEITTGGGEGVMLRDPESVYERRRSKTLLKVKKMLDDECVVFGYIPGDGKYRGMVGSLKCKMPTGVEVSVGSGLSDAERRDPVKIGTVINIGYQGLSNDLVPRFPRFLRVSDKTWPEVLRTHGIDRDPPLVTTKEIVSKAIREEGRDPSTVTAEELILRREGLDVKGSDFEEKKVKKKPRAASGLTIEAKKTYHYEVVNEYSDKFWEIRVEGNAITVRYGKNLTEGRTQTTTEDSPDEALAVAAKKIEAKQKEGYK